MAEITAYLEDVRRDLHIEDQMRLDYLFAAVNYRPEEHVIPRPRGIIPELWQSIKGALQC